MKTTDDDVDDRSADRQQAKDSRMKSVDDDGRNESLDVTRSTTSLNDRVDHNSDYFNVV